MNSCQAKRAASVSDALPAPPLISLGTVELISMDAGAGVGLSAAETEPTKQEAIAILIVESLTPKRVFMVDPP